MSTRSRASLAVVISTVSVLLAGCSSGGAGRPDGSAGSGGGGAGSGGADAAADGAQGTLYGNMAVNLFPDNAYATVTAQFFETAPPPIIPVAPSQQQGDCQLLVPTNPTCATGCDGGICTGTNQCTASPRPANPGTLVVGGLAGMSLSLDPVPPMFAYSSPTLVQPFPPCAEGDDITVQAAAFTLAIKCITPLVVTSAVPIPVRPNQPTRLAWTPPGRAGISRVQIILEISHHGGYKGEIDCDVADTGSFDIPASLVTALIDLGLAGYPTVQLARAASATPASEPGVKLTMPSRSELEVDTGVISCGAPSSPACPTGTTCGPGMTCQ